VPVIDDTKPLPEARANGAPQATPGPTALSDTIDPIRIAYRRAKAAEDTRNRLGAGTIAYVRTYVSGWNPNADKAERKKRAAGATRVVKHVLRHARPIDNKGRGLMPFPDVLDKVELEESDEAILTTAGELIRDIAGPWWRFEAERQRWRHKAEMLARSLPGWSNISHVSGFSVWGFVAIIGEFGDLTDLAVPESEREPGRRYGGVRRIYKRFGLAPDACYPAGARRTGLKIPRATRGRIMGVIAEPLLRQQWRGEKKDDSGSQQTNDSHEHLDPAVVPAHAIGPYGQVYGEAKARHLADGWEKLHADKAARRAMVKALIHDVHKAWHGLELTYAAAKKG
jgi:hypothetical protein